MKIKRNELTKVKGKQENPAQVLPVIFTSEQALFILISAHMFERVILTSRSHRYPMVIQDLSTKLRSLTSCRNWILQKMRGKSYTRAKYIIDKANKKRNQIEVIYICRQKPVAGSTTFTVTKVKFLNGFSHVFLPVSFLLFSSIQITLVLFVFFLQLWWSW